MTKQELIDRMIAKQRAKLLLNWGQIISTINGASQEKKDDLVAALNKADVNSIGSIIVGILGDERTKMATSDVNKLIVNNKVDLDDISSII